ncbi:MAG: chemotaxis protein CheD [Candidatus Woesearchaeota archaeon]
MDNIIVGIGKYAVSTTHTLTAIGLGSCVGVCLFNEDVRGLIHIMLPDSSHARFEDAPFSLSVCSSDSSLQQQIRAIAQGQGVSEIVVKHPQQMHDCASSGVIADLRDWNGTCDVQVLQKHIVTFVHPATIQDYSLCSEPTVVDMYEHITESSLVIAVEQLKQFRMQRFADTGIPMMLKRLSLYTKKPLQAKIAGGASMFEHSHQHIGSQNSESIKKILHTLNIPIIQEHIGGNEGRTMTVYADNKVQIRTKSGMYVI